MRQDLRLLRRALDRRLVARADLDPAGLRRLRLRDGDLQHAVAVCRAHVVLGDALRQADGAGEAAEPALVAVEAVALSLLRPLTLAADRQRAVVELDRDLVLGDARQIERVDDLALRLPDVDGRAWV